MNSEEKMVPMGCDEASSATGMPLKPMFTSVLMMVNMGFNGIPVALLASSHPIGTIFSSLFISYIQVGGESLQPEFAKEIIDIIIAAIIYLSAFALLVQGGIARLLSRKHERAAGKEED